METVGQKTERNRRVQARYDELMREGNHGHYETMFRVVREEVERERERCAKLRALLDAVRLTVDPIAINENLRRNIQMALHDTRDLGSNTGDQR